MRHTVVILFLLPLLSGLALAQLNSIDALRLYDEGLNALTVGAGQNDQVAVERIRRAADLGYPPALVALGYIYETGVAHVAPDQAIALEWYKKATKQDDRLGDWVLGRAYLVGMGTPRDLNLATAALRKGANQDDPFAEYLLGLVQKERGQYGEAADWFRKAAMQGLPQAQYQLGLLLKDAPGGVKPDKFEAYVWLLISSRAGNVAAGTQLGLLESELGATQVEEAKSRARELEATVTRVVVARGCTGWNGEFADIPSPPPLDIQGFCR
jgi:TPR repeat protein